MSTVDDTLKSFAEAVDEKIDIRRHSTGLKRAENLAFFEEAGPNLPGWIIIQTNLTMGNNMIRIDIDGYTYWPYNNIIDLSVTGYAFTADNNYYSVDTNNRGTMNFTGIQWLVRNSDGKLALALLPDTTNNYWQYPKIRVGAWVGHTEVTTAQLTGWTMTRAANLTGYTVKQYPDQKFGWNYPTLVNGWANYANGYTPARYRKVNQTVFVQGLIRSGAQGTVAFTLPEGFRPAGGTLIFGVNSDGASSRLDIDTAGNVFPNGGGSGYFSLSGAQFSAER